MKKLGVQGGKGEQLEKQQEMVKKDALGLVRFVIKI